MVRPIDKLIMSHYNIFGSRLFRNTNYTNIFRNYSTKSNNTNFCAPFKWATIFGCGICSTLCMYSLFKNEKQFIEDKQYTSCGLRSTNK